MIVDDVNELIGDTPLLKVAPEVTGLKNVDLYLKLEYLNPFGSVKDRIAWGMTKDILSIVKEKGQRLIENSSGNTAKALAVMALRREIPFRLVSAMVKVRETKEILKLLGVDLEEVSGATNCFDPTDPNDPHYLIEREVARSEGKLIFTSQFTNPANPQSHYDTTGEELLRDLGKIDVFCAGLGTAGTTLGTAQRLREINPELKLVGIVAGKTDFIPGIRTIDQLMEAGIFDPKKYNELVTVESKDALEGMMTLVRRCGVLGGPSSGANLIGTLSYLKKVDASLERRISAVSIVCDRMEWYLSYVKERRPDLFGEKRKQYSIHNLEVGEIVSAPQISFAEVGEWVSKNNPLIVDIRAAMAFEFGSYPGAVNIPSDILEKLLDSKVPFVGEDRAVLFICPVGDQSRRFAAQLNRIGGTGYSLEGGLVAWRGYCS